MKACGSLDGLATGASFSFWTTARYESEPCESYGAWIRPDSQGVPGVTISPKEPIAKNAQNPTHTFIRSNREGFTAQTATGCEGTWSFNIKYTPQLGNFFMAPAPTAPPALLLERSFIPAAAPLGICSQCSDTFVVHLEKL